MSWAVMHSADGATTLVVDQRVAGGAIVYWGSQLAEAAAADTAAALQRSAVLGDLDVVAPMGIVAEHASGHPGRPGLSGHRRDGRDFAPRFAATAVQPGADELTITSADDAAQLTLRTTVRAEPGGPFSITVTLTNDGDDDYHLHDLAPTVALPEHAGELLTVHGRWCRELHLARRPLGDDTVVAENRRGRTSHQHVPLAWAGTPGFGEHHGEVWGVHLAWSGNARTAAGTTDDDRPFLQAGELLLPGEVVLAPGASYTAPPLLLVHSDRGLTPASRQFHRHLRALRTPTASSVRPVTLNTWEAVYFDHDLATLTALASRAAELGVERFVLDDGWFGSRRDDHRGLGDWWVSPVAHPGGLAPLIEHVTRLGMQFGIWVEPEMVNPDSDLYRAHPDWALVDDRYEPVLFRNQLVLDLAHPDAFAEILGRLDALLRDHDIGYLKWDMNRDHVQATGADGRAGTHAQTLAVYRLLDELRAAHPHVEIESCSSGGGRIDLGILRRTDRVWTSDCNDALERQTIQHGASLLIPPEVMGAHIGPPTAHTTGRTHSLAFRAATAFFGHFGIEWNLLDLDDVEATELAGWIALHKRWRPLLHTGDATRLDHSDPHALVHGVLAHDRRSALVAHAQLTAGRSLVPHPVRIPELLDDVRYRVTTIETPGRRSSYVLDKDAAPVTAGLTLTGRQLATHGVRPPVTAPETVTLLEIAARP